MPIDLSKLNSIANGLGAAVDGATKLTADQIMDLGSQLAPYDSANTGPHLNESGQVEPISDGRYDVTWGKGLPDERAPAQEYGTIYQEAQPYATPAIEAIDAEKNVREAIQRLIS